MANIPGGGTGTGPNVTLVNNSNGTVTIGNGIVSVLCTTAGAVLNQINYTYNNGGGTVTKQLLSGGFDGGMFYWELGGFGTGAFSYSVVATPADTGGDYAEIDMLTTSTTNGTVDVHFSMLRGSPGFYVAAIWSHRNGDVAMRMGETRDNIYAGATFNWMSVDATRNRLMEVSGGTAVGVLNAPVEVSLWTNGIYQGQYEDKYKYSADLGVQRAWGWSSVTANGNAGLNVGLWNIIASAEYYNGGPMKRELMCHIGTTILNMLNGSHYGGGTDTGFAANEVWSRVSGPWFIYCNNVSNNITNPVQASQALYNDALAQAAVEQSAWPYTWFTNANYAPATKRGAVSGQFVIQDSYNPNASAAGLWVGVVQTPSSTGIDYDFQEWMKPYQFWVNTDTNGNFTISNVIAGANYTLYAFGPGAAGTFQSQALPVAVNELDIPATPFSVTVTAGATNDLGVVTWKPFRVGATVFEIGYPDRNTEKFRHGDDFWVGDIGPSPTAPSPIWAKHLEYQVDFPNGPDYTVGQSRWSTDWNFVQPIVTDSQGNFDGSTSTINFTLLQAPASGSSASLYVALASDFQGPLIIQVNGTAIAGSTGYFPNDSSSTNESDTTIRQGRHGIFSDNRINFAGSLLKQKQNTITINMRKGGYFANHAMYDYIRLELSGYTPPPPESITAYPGNNCNLLAWPVTPGATSYNLLVSTNSGTNYGTLATNVPGPVCGSGTNDATYLDTNAVNAATYYYVVQSVNPVGVSTNSPPSAGATPSSSLSTTQPAAPAGLAAVAGNNKVVLTWNADPNANYYSVQRSTIVNDGVGTNVTLGTIMLGNAITNTSYSDTTPTDGSTYSYVVTAYNAGGASPDSLALIATPLSASPVSAPGALTVNVTLTTNITLTWSAVSGAVGYVILRSTSPDGPYLYVMSITETTYADVGLVTNTTYYYKVEAVNSGGVSPTSTVNAETAAYWIDTTTSGAQSWNANANWSSAAFPNGSRLPVFITPAITANQTINLNQPVTVGVLNLGASSGLGSLTVAANGGVLTLDNTPGRALLTQVASSKGDTISAPLTNNGSLSISNVSVNPLTVSGGVSGATGGIAIYGNVILGGPILGPVTVNAGSTLSDVPFSALTISNNLTLLAESTTKVRVQHSPLTNDSFHIAGALTEGGTLNVTNAGTSAFAAGDTFNLFNAATYSGSVTNFILPPLSAGLVWNTNTVKNLGILSVAAYLPPEINQSAIIGNTLHMAGSAGIPYWTYYILHSTNLATPQWKAIFTNQFDASGNFTFITTINPAAPQTFYKAQLQ
ncbi:MAG TPA: polysaccharide lyase family protein [Verrucomicrobiae bacterium]|nr:polysaccharide lyase family protein [Verrucomicrobiae bacterium]